MQNSPEMSTCCYRVPFQPQGAASNLNPTWPLLPRPRGRRHLKVLYPPLVRRPLPQDGASPTRRWLLILMALLFLQIYSEEVLDLPEDQHINLEEEWKPTAGQCAFAEEAVSSSWVYADQGIEEPCSQQIWDKSYMRGNWSNHRRGQNLSRHNRSTMQKVLRSTVKKYHRVCM